MKNILEQFYYGNITPCETTVTDNRFQKIVSKLDEAEAEFDTGKVSDAKDTFGRLRSRHNV